MSTRDSLLELLRANRNKFVSGAQLTGILGVSRTAVSKHVASLKREGYLINAFPGKGYMFCDTPDLLLPDEIRHGLETDIFGKCLIDYHVLIESTNNRAKELALKGAEEGTVVVAEEQSGGRGRKGRYWFSDPFRGIYLSMILRPSMIPSEASQITLMTAVALAETLREISDLDVTIKWPNDILVHRRKLSGILTEMSMEMDRIDFIVVGVGINVNTPSDHFPAEVRSIASSLAVETGKTISRVELLKLFLVKFEFYYGLVKNSGFFEIMKRWRAFSDIIGRNVAVDIIGTRIRGIVEDVGDDGVLVIRDKEGLLHRVISGDVLLQDL